MAEDSTVKPRSVELKNDKEREIKYYQTYLDSLAQGKSVSSEIFTNKGEARASILMATLLANTTKTLKLYCRGLSPGILCGKKEGDGKGFEGAYWEEFKIFFEEQKKYNSVKVEILIQDTTWLYHKPFQVIKDAIKSSNIQVKKIDTHSKQRIDNLLGNANGENYNFAIFDSIAFRLEYNPDNYQAMGSFHNPSWCKLLTYLFDEAFQKADPIKTDDTSLFYIQKSDGKKLYVDSQGFFNIEKGKEKKEFYILQDGDKKTPIQIDQDGNLSVLIDGNEQSVPACQGEDGKLYVKGYSSNIEIIVTDNKIEFYVLQDGGKKIPVQIQRDEGGNISIFVLIDGNEQCVPAYQGDDGNLYVGYDEEKKKVTISSDGSLSLLSV